MKTIYRPRLSLIIPLLALGMLFSALSSSSPEQARAAASSPPLALTPADGAPLDSFSPILSWQLPPDATQYHLKVEPLDGPSINLIRAAESSFTIPAPPAWYGLLPDMSYSWKVRTTAATTAVGENDPSWGPWSTIRTFQTPRVATTAVALAEPQDGAQASEPPVLIWELMDPTVWYVEVQVSADVSFNTDPATATAPVAWVTRHSAVSNPPNSYAVPLELLTQAGARYYWRVRPRVQGDGTPLPWGPARWFTTKSGSGTTRITLQDSGKTFSFPIGTTFQLDLGTSYRWAVTADPPGVIEELPTMGPAAMPRLFRTIAVGRTSLQATGDLPCRDSMPPCMAPSLMFQVTIEVLPASVQEAAPIHSATVKASNSAATEYLVRVVSGLPNGCARYSGHTVQRNGAIIQVTVTNLMPADKNTACTMIYGMVEHDIPLPGTFVSGQTYTVYVNDTKVIFMAGKET